MSKPIKIKPEAIEAKSFAIIKEEFYQQTGKRPEDFPAEQFAVIQRVIHATGDFSFADSLTFHPEAISRAITALRAGRDLAVDVNMVAAGINKRLLAQWGGKVICKLADPEIAEVAARESATRSEVAMREALLLKPAIIAIGNAPTALLRVIDLLQHIGPNDSPTLIIGVPVGFVNAAESKELLAQQSMPFITSLGRKGGSPVAASIVNALIKLATNPGRNAS